MLQLLRLRELPMLPATARARGVGSRKGACSMCSFRFNCVKLLWQLLRLLPHLWQQFPALFMLGEKNKHSAPTNTHSHTAHTHTHRRMESALSILFDCRKSWHFSDFSHVSVEKRKNNFQCLLISFRPSVASSCLFRSRPPSPAPSTCLPACQAVTPSGSRPLLSPA